MPSVADLFGSFASLFPSFPAVVSWLWLTIKHAVTVLAGPDTIRLCPELIDGCPVCGFLRDDLGHATEGGGYFRLSMQTQASPTIHLSRPKRTLSISLIQCFLNRDSWWFMSFLNDARCVLLAKWGEVATWLNMSNHNKPREYRIPHTCVAFGYDSIFKMALLLPQDVYGNMECGHMWTSHPACNDFPIPKLLFKRLFYFALIYPRGTLSKINWYDITGLS